MRIQDLFEDQNIAAPNPQNINSAYKVGKVNFDCINGLGAVPYNQEVKYMGFAMMISPSAFLSLAAYGDREDTAKELAQKIIEGTPLGPPFLFVNINPEYFKGTAPLLGKVSGHEGRGRMRAIAQVDGNIPIPVHVFLRGERARSLNDEFFIKLREIGLIPERGDNPRKFQIGEIFCMGKTL